MIGFILRFLKGLILGWLMSLVFFMVKRILAKAMGHSFPSPSSPFPKSRQTSPPRNYEKDGNVVETIWIGMSAAHLRENFGLPKIVERQGAQEIWVYPNLNNQGVDTRVTLENDKIKSWEEATPASQKGAASA